MGHKIKYRPALPDQGTHACRSEHRRGAVNTIAYEEGKARSIISSPSPVIHHKFLIPDPSKSASILHRTSPIFNGSGISTSGSREANAVFSVDFREFLTHTLDIVRQSRRQSSSDPRSIGTVFSVVYQWIRDQYPAVTPIPVASI